MFELFVNRSLIQKRMEEQFRPADHRPTERSGRFRAPARAAIGQAQQKRRVRRLWELLGQA